MDQTTPQIETRKSEATRFSEESIRFSEYRELRSRQLRVTWEKKEMLAGGGIDIPHTTKENEWRTETSENLEQEPYSEGDEWKLYPRQEGILTLSLPLLPMGETLHNSDSNPDLKSCDSTLTNSSVQPDSMEVGENGSNLCRPESKLSSETSLEPVENNTRYNIVTQLTKEGVDGLKSCSEPCAVAENMTAGLYGALGVEKQPLTVVGDNDNTPRVCCGWEKTGASDVVSVPPSQQEEEEEEREKWRRLWRELVLKENRKVGSGLVQMKNSTLSSASAVVDSVVMCGRTWDLVKSHLMYAVREEVEVLKEQIKELMERLHKLEQENKVLRSEATPDTLSKLPPPLPPIHNPLLQQLMTSLHTPPSTSST